jgi:hypothetical protein
MDLTEIGVIIGGAAGILFALWYFFGEREAVNAPTGAGGVNVDKHGP